MSPAIELGRSFIRGASTKLRCDPHALAGDGSLSRENTRNTGIFSGPSTSADRYKAASKQLIASYLRPGADDTMSRTITAHTPPYADTNFKRAVEQQPLHVLQLADIDAMITKISSLIDVDFPCSRGTT